MIIIPPHRPSEPVDPRKVRHDTTVGMLVFALLMLGIAVFIFAIGPLSNDPPPFMVGVAMLGLAVIFGLVSFYSWMAEQAHGDESAQGNNPKEEP